MTLESWSMGIVRPVMEIYPYAWLVFISYIVIVGMIALNLIVGVIVNSLNEINK
ncbi:ion transporter [Campylobacter lanienae]|nr:ion transporter [Campylobacter lanienae]